MDGIILASIAARNEFRPPQKPFTEHEFRPTEVGALARCYRVEEGGRIG